MAYTNRRQDLEYKYGEKMETLLPRKVRELGTLQAVAKEFGVSYAALYNWMQEMGMKRQMCLSIPEQQEK